jgi:hypothetical protein
VDITKLTETTFSVIKGDVTFTLSLVPYEGSFAVQIEGGRDLWEKRFSLFQGSSTLILKGLEKPSHIARIEDQGFQKEGDLYVKKADHKGVLSQKFILPAGLGVSSYFVVALPKSDGEVEIVKLTESGCNYLWTVEQCPENGALLAAWAYETLGQQKSPEMLVVKTAPEAGKRLEEAGFYSLEGTTYALVIPDQENEAELTLFHTQLADDKYLLAFADKGRIFYGSCLSEEPDEWVIEGLEPHKVGIERLVHWIRTLYLIDNQFTVEATPGSKLAEELLRQGFKQRATDKFTYTVPGGSLDTSYTDNTGSTDTSAVGTPFRQGLTPLGRTPDGYFSDSGVKPRSGGMEHRRRLSFT